MDVKLAARIAANYDMDVKLAARIAANYEHDIHTHNFPLHCQIVLKF